ncbi:MAG TPA: hypothetical protein VGP47_06520 [Parachlamydiaceae bacterium]|nr:hypothetical protein [Parachlamydiaceae bacterium]
MYKQIKKIPRYLLKLLRSGSPKEVFHIVKNVKAEHLLIALAARLDRKSTGVSLRDEHGAFEINNFLDLIPIVDRGLREIFTDGSLASSKFTVIIPNC